MIGAGLALLFAVSVCVAQPPDAPKEKPLDPVAVKFFETNVRPVLAGRCFECHGPKRQRNDLRVDSLAALLEGGKSGPALKPGHPEQSLLIRAIRHTEKLQMPQKEKLPAKEIADLTAWVKMGAPWPDAVPTTKSPTTPDAEPVFTAEQKSFWAFVPPKKLDVPKVKKSAWVQSPIDAFILAKLEEKGLSPALPADPRTLLRRMYFDLIGLPPTPKEIADFELRIADWQKKSPQSAFRIPQSAIQEVLDRLLASPRYGERWGRHWLDVARYADSNGMDENLVYANAWRYRDYVIKAFNDDEPYDQFVREQIAGDLLPPPAPPSQGGEKSGIPSQGGEKSGIPSQGGKKSGIPSQGGEKSGIPSEGGEKSGIPSQGGKQKNFSPPYEGGAGGVDRADRIIATGFLVIGPKMLAEDDPVKMEMDIIDEQVDTIGRTFMGLTLGCARCHDHKFDPLPTADYYSLAGIFKSTQTMDNFKVVARWHERNLETPASKARLAEHQTQVDQLKAKIKTAEASDKAALPKLQDELRKLLKAAPDADEAMAVREQKPVNLRVHLRGNHLTLGKDAPRRFPRILSAERPLSDDSSGRLALANWLTKPDHPLTSRVMVNRLWHWHFGAGLVRSPDNFGRLGDRPTNQPLLDWLAVRFVESGWSIKAMHRAIMLSSTYQMSTASNDGAAQLDPENRLHGRMNRKRLEAEAIRDSLLFVSGSLDLKMGGTLLQGGNRNYVPGYPNSNYDKYDIPRRSVYLPVLRSMVYDVFQAFDFADPSVANGERANTTVAPQALFMLNSKLVADNTRALAEMLLKDEKRTDQDRVRLVYETLYARAPSAKGTSRALDFIRRLEQEYKEGTAIGRRVSAWQSLCRVLVAANEFVYVE